MTYPALPDMRIAYDNDGTVVDAGSTFDGPSITYPTGAQLIAMQGLSPSGVGLTINPDTGPVACLWMFFPEQREVTAYWSYIYAGGHGGFDPYWTSIKGSNDTTNGIDGTWETASISLCTFPNQYAWRSGIKSISFTGPKKVIRFETDGPANDAFIGVQALHVYGSKGPGQTPDDIIFLDGSAGYAAFTAPIDFGDVPLGTTQQHLFKVHNASPTKTANTINIQCNDADFAISSDGVTWVVTINIASLAAGADSGILYVRNTTPNPGGRLGPRFARIVVTVASYT